VNGISNFFLRAKDWQLFLLAVGGLPYVATGKHSLLPLAFLAQVSYLAWLWATGSFLCAVSRRTPILGLRLFRIAILCLLVCSTLGIVFAQNKLGLPANLLGGLTAVLIFSLLLAIVGWPYVLYFMSRNLLLAERDGPLTLTGYVGKFLLIGFFPVGVWLIQPTINRLFSGQREPV
jgi:hypothetical protein